MHMMHCRKHLGNQRMAHACIQQGRAVLCYELARPTPETTSQDLVKLAKSYAAMGVDAFVVGGVRALKSTVRACLKGRQGMLRMHIRMIFAVTGGASTIAMFPVCAETW